MPIYTVPLRDKQFLLYEMLDMPSHYPALGIEDLDRDTVDAILIEGSKFCTQVLAPLNQLGDEQGCRLHEGQVITPDGFKQAYQQWVDNGWPALSQAVEFGGQGLPESIGVVIQEMVGTANWSWGMYPGLSQGAMNTLAQHGSTEQKDYYLTQLVSGNWTGTMCLTESHCGSDLGQLKTKAIPLEDGSYQLQGTKIFISSGDHDLTDNIVHIVLARLPNAPEGTQGISLFIVPKILANGQRNAVNCGALEHKMGIHGNATCVLNFDGAQGFLIGPENKGLNCMFTFMNFARLGTALQGLAATERAYQGALSYAQERLSMRALSGAQYPDLPADPLIVHADVRRMLLTQKAFAEGGRALVYMIAQLLDQSKRAQDESARQQAEELTSFLTPIAKAFITETGVEAANLGIQVFGGHGYIKEWGMEQILRDVRISTLYEGTTGIQALDLLGRKVLLTQGERLKQFTKIIHQFCQQQSQQPFAASLIQPLAALNTQWGEVTLAIGMKALQNKEEVGAAAYDYLMYSGYIVLAYLWARMACVAQQGLEKQPQDSLFYQAKIKTAQFYYQRLLPRTESHRQAMLAGVEGLMAPQVDELMVNYR